MATIPDCTLTTACYFLNKYNPNSRSLEECVKGLEDLLSVPCYLVIYCNEPLAEHIFERRTYYKLGNMTSVVIKEIEELWAYQFADKIRHNRMQYWPTYDARISIESTALVFNKFQFVLETIHNNPFSTTKFGWIDGYVGEKGIRLCADGNFQKQLLYTLDHLPNSFRVQMLNVEDKMYKEDTHKREFYEKARWIVVGGFFTTGEEIGKKIITRIKEVIAHTIELGYGHGDEYFYLEVLDEFYDDITRAYGDYKDTMHNFIRPVKNMVFIYLGTVMGNYRKGYYKECIAACRDMIASFDDYLTEPNFDMYVRLYSQLYLALRAIESIEADDVANTIRCYYRTHPLFAHYFDELKYLCDMSDFIQ